LNITIQNVELAVFLPDGRSIKVEGLTSDTAERVLEVNFAWPQLLEMQKQVL
jgi:hypothetical protein